MFFFTFLTHENEVLHLFLASFVENLPLKLTFDLEYTKNVQTFQAGTLDLNSAQKIYKKNKKNIVYVTKQG